MQTRRRLEPPWGRGIFVPLPWGKCQSSRWPAWICACCYNRHKSRHTAWPKLGPCGMGMQLWMQLLDTPPIPWAASPTGVPPSPVRSPPTFPLCREVCGLAELSQCMGSLLLGWCSCLHQPRTTSADTNVLYRTFATPQPVLVLKVKSYLCWYFIIAQIRVAAIRQYSVFH